MTEKRVLNNIRILDFTWVLAGPYATRLLADFGAEVIKVQPLLSAEGDDTFTRGYYNTWNRNKRGITLNLDKLEGITLAKKLATISDAVIENFTPRVMVNWGLDYAGLKKVKPDIIMVSMSAKGQGSHYTGYGPTVHALSGLTGQMSLEGKPLGPGFSYADHVAGLYASLSLLGALEHRRRTGEGRHVDISETDMTAGLLPEKEAPKAPDNIYPCKGENRWCAITADTEQAWQGLKRAMGNPAWSEDVTYNTLESRYTNKEKLDTLIGGWTRGLAADEVMSLLQQNGVAAGVVQDAAGLAQSRQLNERGFFMESAGVPFQDAPPNRMENQRAEYRQAPSPGQDNDYVYGELLGLSKREIETLGKEGII